MSKKLILILGGLVILHNYAATNPELISNPESWLYSRVALLESIPKGGIVAEIGVQSGDHAAMILKYTNPRELYLIDCWEHQDEALYPNDSANVNNKEQNIIYENVKKRFAHDPRVTVIKSYSSQASLLFENHFFDWVYLDSNHTYAAVHEDLTLWYPKVKPGGFFTGHDYCRGWWGVIQAVNEFLALHNLNLFLLSVPRDNLGYAFHKPE